jgi:hypothetical protein
MINRTMAIKFLDFIGARFNTLRKVKNGKSQKRGGDFTENRKK